MPQRFDGKAAIVTGSSSGIGKSIALRLAREGAAVCGVANRNADGGQATAHEIADAGGRSLFVQADVSADADCRRVVDEALAAFGRVDILVNNAGITRAAALDQGDEAFWDHVLDTNLKSAYLMTRYAVADMLLRGWGRVIHISSVHAAATHGGYAAYAASKAGMCGMTRAMACELGGRGVCVTCVLPGSIDISLHPRPGRPGHPVSAVDRDTWQPRATDIQVSGRQGSPDEVAALVCFLASEESSYVNGSVLAVDGGLLSILKDR